jgi:hypothetical protein
MAGQEPGAGWQAGIPSSHLTMWLMCALSQRNVTAAAESFGYKIFSRLLTVLFLRLWDLPMCAMCMYAYVCNVCEWGLMRVCNRM